MEIISFKPSNDRKSLTLVLANAAAATTLLLFTNKTYKNYNKAINLSSKLNGLADQTITITLGDLKQPYLDGLYFVQLESPGDISNSICADTTRYRECVMDKIMTLDTCEECLKDIAQSIMVVEALLTGLKIAVEDGYVEQAFNQVKALDKLCGNACKNCGKLNNVESTNYFNTSSNG